MTNLSDINHQQIARVSTKRLKGIIRKSEVFVTVQLANIKAIDSRATQIMTSLGLILSIMIGVLALNETTLTFPLGYGVFFGFLGLAALSTICCLIVCLRIIQSDNVSPPGNDGLELLNDLSNMYSEHEEDLDYILVLSESCRRNEKLIRRNGKLLKWASFLFFVAVVMILISGTLLALEPKALFAPVSTVLG